MRFQYISDTHLEKSNARMPPLQPVAENLILGGDIGNPNSQKYKALLEEASKKFKNVFLIAGNHEFSKKTVSETREAIQEVTSSLANVFFLDNTAYDFPDSDITIFGTTLWTPIPEKFDASKVSDHRHIRGFTLEARNALHSQARADIVTHVLGRPHRRFVVVTHHVPRHFLASKEFDNNPLNCAYVTDVPELDSENIVAVVYGHTHTAHAFQKYRCSPIGHPGENRTPCYTASFEIGRRIPRVLPDWRAAPFHPAGFTIVPSPVSPPPTSTKVTATLGIDKLMRQLCAVTIDTPLVYVPCGS